MAEMILTGIIILLGLAAAWIGDELLVDAIKRRRAKRLWAACMEEAQTDLAPAPAADIVLLADRKYRKLAKDHKVPLHLTGTHLLQVDWAHRVVRG